MLKKVTSLLLIILTAFSIFGIGFSSWLIVNETTKTIELPLVVPDVGLFLTLNEVEQNFILTDVGFQTDEYEMKEEGSLAFDLTFKNAEARDSGDIFVGNVATFNTKLLALNNNAYALLSGEFFTISMNKTYNGITTEIDSADVIIDNDFHHIIAIVPITFSTESLATFSIRYNFLINDLDAYTADFGSMNTEPFRFQFSIETMIHGDD